jgi:aspartate 1-decarboxylase
VPGKRGQPLIICNKQATGADAKARVRYFGSISTFLAAIVDVCAFMCADVRHTAQNLLPREEIEAWEAQRGARLAAYDAKRKS